MGEGLPFGISKTKRLVVPKAEAALYNSHAVNGGSVTLVDYMGGDDMTCRVASAGHGIEIFSEKPDQEQFISYLAHNGIIKPFNFTQMKVSVRAPIEAALSLVYLPEVNVNEYSGRYSVMLDSQEPLDENRLRELGVPSPKLAAEIISRTREQTRHGYKQLLDVDLARELSRIGLSTSTDTEFFLKVDLPSLARAYLQQERQNANPAMPFMEELAALASAIAPHSWRSLTRPTANALFGRALSAPSDHEIVDGPLNAPQWKPSDTKRIVVPTMEEMLFSEKPLLERGGVQAIDYMGDDQSLAEAARVSYGVGTRKLSTDMALVKRLIRDEHTSPVEMAEFSTEAKVPMFADPRQAGRHRTLPWHSFMGQVPLGDEFYIPPDDQFKYQDRVNRQGRGKLMDESEREHAKLLLCRTRDDELAAAKELRSLGVPDSLIRKLKGVGFYTRITRTGDAHNWGHFFKLRSDPHAQWEVRQESLAYEEIFKAFLPQTYAALRAHVIDSITLSAHEQELMKNHILMQAKETLPQAMLRDKNFSSPVQKGSLERKINAEGMAFLRKLDKL